MSTHRFTYHRCTMVLRNNTRCWLLERLNRICPGETIVVLGCVTGTFQNTPCRANGARRNSLRGNKLTVKNAAQHQPGVPSRRAPLGTHYSSSSFPNSPHVTTGQFERERLVSQVESGHQQRAMQGLTKVAALLFTASASALVLPTSYWESRPALGGVIDYGETTYGVPYRPLRSKFEHAC